jgi:murein DD-endopeptidase MepM/ murein hydrolase activator NlpD
MLETAPDQIMNPEEVLQKLETGDVQPTKYTVQQGDCVSCIAAKFGISKQLIYQNNPWIENDKIKVGQQLDLTVLQPTLTVKTVEKVVENQEIQYDTIYEQDANLRKGVTRTIKPGESGLKMVTFFVTKENGLLMEEELVEEEVIEEPVAAVVKKGTKVIQGEGTGKFSWPVIGSKVTSSFGIRWGRMHNGIDIVSRNRNIVASDNGVVIFAGNKNDGYGNMIIIDHKNGYRTIYAHLSKFYTIKGKIVEKGERIAYMGNSGDSTGVHLHFEIHRSGNTQNPIRFLSR